MHATNALAEADRLMTVCNSCRYCEGLCAVFPAMEMRRAFADGDLNYLANLCHGCGACYYDCQFSPPHEFEVNVPQVLAQVRAESYGHYARPGILSGVFKRSGIAVAGASALAVAALFAGFAIWQGPDILFGVHVGPGAFYRLMPHNAMALLFGIALLFAVAVIGLGVRAFLRDIAEPAATPAAGSGLWQATRDAGELRYLDGGGAGCGNAEGKPQDRRRLYHHLTFYGFMLCLAATSVATLYHYLFGWEAPYPWWDLPVVLGTLGGIGIVIGPLGLMAQDRRREAPLKDPGQAGLGTAFCLTLVGLGVTGLALLVFRETAAMGTLLALHLGAVLGFFLTMPYGKFVHGIYRYVALARFAREREAQNRGTPAH
ncbi:tricarballylate utilization 4Fe-4S protein TcuB [Roseixanthobacter liquoris]|uniref:tricarballylate utilization 4Fe-4S protein TcuB n=1 Tax=Roseixanthobacter liquoris TaxID=3119921 RepID=UPI003729EED3